MSTCQSSASPMALAVALVAGRTAQATSAAAGRKVPSTARICLCRRDRSFGSRPRPPCGRVRDRSACEDRLEPLWVGDLLEVGERAAADFRDREVLLGLLGLAEILDGAEGADRGVEEGQEIGDEALPKPLAMADLCNGLSAFLARHIFGQLTTSWRARTRAASASPRPAGPSPCRPRSRRGRPVAFSIWVGLSEMERDLNRPPAVKVEVVVLERQLMNVRGLLDHRRGKRRQVDPFGEV